MVLIGLTGGMASGKSTVARMLESKGAVVIDADVIAREVVVPKRPAFRQIIERFGPEMAGADGEIDRKALGDLIFKDPEARRDLEAITLPEIYKEIKWRIEQHRESKQEGAPTEFVVVDAALLVETGGAELLGLDALVVVRSQRDLQIQRAVAHRNMGDEEASARLAAQAPISEKLAAADYVIDNRGSLEELQESVDTLWAELVKKFK